MSESQGRASRVKVSPEEYKNMTKKATPGPKVIKNTIMGFLVGGMICSIGQIIVNSYMIYAGLPKPSAQIAGSATLIFIGALLTGLGVYDELVRIGGAGAIVPVTGFANSMVSPALEFKREGYVMGVGGKLFTIAGPILVYGIVSSIIVGLITVILR